MAAQISFEDLLSRPHREPTEKIPYGTQADQFIELWLPEGETPFKVVILIHGGCWLADLPGLELMNLLAEDLQKSGYAVWNIEYRRLGTEGAGYPGTFNDVAKAIDSLRDNAEKFNLDLNHVTLIGHSAGGHLALWAAGRKNIAPQSKLYFENPLPIEKVISLSGINDLQSYRDAGSNACGGSRTIDALIGASDRPQQEIYKDTSPAEMLPLGISQTIVTGGLDNIVPPIFGQNYARKAQKTGDIVIFQEFPEAGHFDLIDPGSAAWAAIKTLLN